MSLVLSQLTLYTGGGSQLVRLAYKRINLFRKSLNNNVNMMPFQGNMFDIRRRLLLLIIEDEMHLWQKTLGHQLRNI